MSSRPQPFAAAPKAMEDFFRFSTRVAESGLEHSLLELVKIRASQINGCANCLNMHTSDARKAGETDQRLHLIAAWQDAPCYTDRERAALAWTDHITQIAKRRAPDEVYAGLDAHFDKEEQVQLTMAIIVINGWNRLAVGFDMFDPKLGW
ncbi:carboxymuconolactone decarboxylase family protein [Altererythrobacter sp. CC-YST694]|uniref:carboxymuconolactone decarboxylase family protein n=1 Tax=Altererythrobacter sp. CC-YST694 TaxID=2755038 RepID=UPI001D0340BF|nr:carboxymuconolactone decarboxylase family protein [Altererythrobacter sp. CC-YST694]MCB5424931.1 carboxymuconolactone decarboxylase family protein [Altererythrobacter sp. CC-YST694]